MLLAVDIGNTNITLAIFEDNQIIETFRTSTDRELDEQEYALIFKAICTNYEITDCVIGSVVSELNILIKKTCDKLFKINSLLLNNEYLNFKINVENPKTVGIDRLANTYGASVLYSTPAIVVDIGTAITFDIISENKEFIGGAIMPGIDMQFKALNINTSKLPRISAETSEKAIGNNTEKAILSGVIRGTASAIDGLLEQSISEINSKPIIIGTGGQCKQIEKYMKSKFDYINPDLTLLGIKYLYDAQVAKSI